MEAFSGGRLRVRSLRDPEVQALLDRARPGWQWEPMLVEIEGEWVRIFAGLSLRARLVQVLGPVRALRLAQVVARHGGPVLGVDWGRRDFLRRTTGALAGWIALRSLGRPVPAAAASPTPPTDSEGELWEGFLLLPAGAPLPAWVRSSPTPFLCQSDSDEATVAPLRGAILRFDRFEEIAPQLSFPFSFPDILPSEFTFYGIYVTIFQQSRKIFSVSATWVDSTWEPLIRVVAQPTPPSPYPVWPVFSPETPDVLIPPEKVFFLPQPGLLLPSARGYLALWLEQSVLYILIAEHDRRRESFINIAQSLRKVSKR